MQLHASHLPGTEVADSLAYDASMFPAMPQPLSEDSGRSVTEPSRFYTQYVDYMELLADAGTVAQYFDDHASWFCRCAHPMKADPLGKYGYALTIGRFGAFGYDVEPKIGLNMLPPERGVYRIETIPVPNYEPQAYDVDFRAAMELVEVEPDERLARQLRSHPEIKTITRIQWQLDLTVLINFPRFIHRLPSSLVQSTGDRLLAQVVRQVSHRLNRKVEKDFSQTYGAPIL